MRKSVFAAAAVCVMTALSSASAETFDNERRIVFAADSPYVYDNGIVVDLGAKSFVYDGSAYVPIAAAVGAMYGAAESDGENMKITYRDKSFDIPLSSMRQYMGAYYIKAKDIAEAMGISVFWRDGIVILSESANEISEMETAKYKAELRYTGNIDMIDEERYAAEEKIVYFSEEGGFYREPQLLELSTNLRDAQIYYTTDGSDPAPWSETSYLYTEPLYIGNRSWADNLWSNVKSVVEEGFRYPKGAVMKGTCIKARAFNDYEETKMYVNSYYIAEDIFDRYKVKTVSITAPAEGLFDKDTGIYSYNNSVQVTNWRECEAFMEVFDESGQRVVHQPIGLRLNGAGTRILQQKALRVYSRENALFENGDKKKFKYDFFNGAVSDIFGNNISEYKRVILRNGGDDWKRFFVRDVLVHDICRNTGIDTQGYSPAVIFLNGEYWGVHQIRERYDNKYFKSHYGLISDDDAVLIEIAKHPMRADLNEGTEEDLQDFNDKAYFIINNDMSLYDNYMTAQSYFDFGNMIDYYILNIFFENVDWPQNNVKIWRNKNPENTSVDTRYRFVISDCDTTCEDNGAIYIDAYGPDSEMAAKWKYKSSEGTLGYKLDDAECLVNVMLHSLMANKNFEIEFVRRYNDYLNTILRSYSVKGHMDNIYKGVIELRDEHRYRYPASWNEYSVDALKEWADNRPAKARKEIKNYFGYNSMVDVSFIADNTQGHINANTLTLVPGNNMGIENPGNFTASYYKSLPLWFKAVPNNGYEFDYFTVNGQVWNDAETVFSPTEDTTVEAHFKPAYQPEAQTPEETAAWTEPAAE